MSSPKEAKMVEAEPVPITIADVRDFMVWAYEQGKEEGMAEGVRRERKAWFLQAPDDGGAA